jgi:hypothetical protein
MYSKYIILDKAVDEDKTTILRIHVKSAGSSDPAVRTRYRPIFQ